MTTTTASSMPSRRTLLAAVRRRDPAWDGLFIVAVRTTKIACRPVCPSRPALPENLSFFPTLDAALAAGFRSCLRCKPQELGLTPAWWLRLIALADAADQPRLTDRQLIEAGFDPVRVRRFALKTFGVTFHAWLRARRLANAQQQLRRGAKLDRVIINSSWESHSGFRDAFTQLVGTSPGRARTGEPVITTTWTSPLGPMVAAAVDEGVVLLEFGDLARIQQQIPRLQRWFKGPVVDGTHPHLTQMVRELEEYFAGTRRKFTVPLALRGSPFELSVWRALLKIPYGVTCSYGDIARTVDNAGAVRAVGSANGRNRLPIIIPCHRVVNTGGKLGGYGGGLWRKVRLLELEGVHGDWGTIAPST